jgi:hypothetical protein
MVVHVAALKAKNWTGQNVERVDIENVDNVEANMRPFLRDVVPRPILFVFGQQEMSRHYRRGHGADTNLRDEAE